MPSHWIFTDEQGKIGISDLGGGGENFSFQDVILSILKNFQQNRRGKISSEAPLDFTNEDLMELCDPKIGQKAADAGQVCFGLVQDHNLKEHRIILSLSDLSDIKGKMARMRRKLVGLQLYSIPSRSFAQGIFMHEMEYKGSLNGKKIYRHKFNIDPSQHDSLREILKARSTSLVEALEHVLNEKFEKQNVKCK